MIFPGHFITVNLDWKNFFPAAEKSSSRLYMYVPEAGPEFFETGQLTGIAFIPAKAFVFIVLIFSPETVYTFRLAPHGLSQENIRLNLFFPGLGNIPTSLSPAGVGDAEGVGEIVPVGDGVGEHEFVGEYVKVGLGVSDGEGVGVCVKVGDGV